MDISNPEVLSAVISAIGNIVAAVIASICATIVGKHLAGRKQLQAKFDLAVKDIEFLLTVEEKHCALHVSKCGESFKHRIRKSATTNGISWSGMFTPGRAKFLSKKD